LFALDALITGGHGQGFAKRLSHFGVAVVATGETDPIRAASAFYKGESLPPAAPHEHHHATSAEVKL
jgi:predicted Fe-Mo cluster-binding NifX family protein